MTIDTIVFLVKQYGPQLIGRLTKDAGLTRIEAERFVPVASTAVVRALKSGAADAIADGDLLGLLDRLNVSPLAAKSRVEERKVGPALEIFLSALSALVGADTGALARLLGEAGEADPGSRARSIAKNPTPKATFAGGKRVQGHRND